jgi:hypothetical protein
VTTTATIRDLLAALDEPGANVLDIVGKLADAYADAGDDVRARVMRWCWKKGAEPQPSAFGRYWDWPRRWWPFVQPESCVPNRVSDMAKFWRVMIRSRSAAYLALADACARWVEQRRGR